MVRILARGRRFAVGRSGFCEASDAMEVECIGAVGALVFIVANVWHGIFDEPFHRHHHLLHSGHGCLHFAVVFLHLVRDGGLEGCIGGCGFRGSSRDAHFAYRSAEFVLELGTDFLFKEFQVVLGEGGHATTGCHVCFFVDPVGVYDDFLDIEAEAGA